MVYAPSPPGSVIIALPCADEDPDISFQLSLLPILYCTFALPASCSHSHVSFILSPDFSAVISGLTILLAMVICLSIVLVFPASSSMVSLSMYVPFSYFVVSRGLLVDSLMSL